MPSARQSQLVGIGRPTMNCLCLWERFQLHGNSDRDYLLDKMKSNCPFETNFSWLRSPLTDDFLFWSANFFMYLILLIFLSDVWKTRVAFRATRRFSDGPLVGLT